MTTAAEFFLSLSRGASMPWNPREHPRDPKGLFTFSGTGYARWGNGALANVQNISDLRHELLGLRDEMRAGQIGPGGEYVPGVRQAVQHLGQATWELLHGRPEHAHVLIGDAGIALSKADPKHPALEPLRDAYRGLARLRREGEARKPGLAQARQGLPGLSSSLSDLAKKAEADKSLPKSVAKALAGAARQIDRENSRGAEGYLLDAQSTLMGVQGLADHAIAAQIEKALAQLRELVKKRRASRALAHEPLGKPGGPGLFHHKGMQLPAYIQHIANDLMQERGMPESVAIATAISQCKKWAASGGNVHPDTRAKAAAAIAEWERLKAQAKVRRSTVAGTPEYDPDGLDESWEGDHADLPDMTGMGVSHMEAAEKAMGMTPPAAGHASRAMPKVGTGARFAKLKASLASKGASDPGGLAAWIGRRKYGKQAFTKLASAARKPAAASRSAPGELLRFYNLEDIHILTRAEGDGSGKVVEAYATVFDTPAEIHDHEGHYMEVIDPGAFDATLQRIRSSPGGFAGAVKVLFNHGKTMEGVPAPEFQLPLGVPLDIRPEKRGLLTRTEYDDADPFTERILSKIRKGSITAQSFVGGIIRSSPELRGPGDRHRRRNGALTTVRRMALGLREYGPVLFPAYTGAEILGVRMQLPGAPEEAAPDYTEDEEYSPAVEGDVAAGTREEVHPAREHAHRLLVMRTEQMCREAGIAPLRSQW